LVDQRIHSTDHRLQRLAEIDEHVQQWSAASSRSNAGRCGSLLTHLDEDEPEKIRDIRRKEQENDGT
jgi:hypothetical protein